ncbi:SNF2 domain-containing protein CLASSY 1-like [Corylus avellana]|uniref:SNF2 domain-containing protein CLASSY 1-like n=1 Tax=Corylus avellana TaxID=13451 RepID=UPI00286B9A15|nr:SNF2 domain-containing protein CLASSY 1-like [Corylus avellana]XP_059457871.1 SNF2 domain-containing protein CLASSY 1-like [Corylus avellana]XP_059457872.1 SNF2 domain-containing protein CLASSY 1-like [Corylus avellana]
MMKKRHLHQSKHVFDDYPFEALLYGSWEAVELIRIINGTMAMHFMDSQYIIEDKSPFSNLRIRSRQATLSDCTCYLRPGIDICVLSASQHAKSSDEENREPVWLDARISSIERKPHEYHCSCQFYVNFYVNQGPLGSETGTLSKEASIVGIDKISILQRLERVPCEDRHYRWAYSENCSELPKTKLFLGKFVSELSWLLVASLFKQIAFDVRSVKNKIVYQILGADDDSCTLDSGNYLNAVNFRVENDILLPTVVQFFPADAIEAGPASEMQEAGSPSYDLTGLRRSKRRNVQPERFLGCDSASEIDVGFVRTRPYKIEQWKDDEMLLPLACLFGNHATSSEVQNEVEQKIYSRSKNPCKDLLVCKSKSKSREVKSSIASQIEHKNQLAIVPLPDESDPIAFEHYHHHAKSRRNYEDDITEISSKYYYIDSTPKAQTKKISGLEDMDFEGGWEGKASEREVQRKRHHSVYTKRDIPSEERTYQKRSLSFGAYKDMINSFLKNMDTTVKKDEPQIIDQWKKCTETNSLDQSTGLEPPPDEDEGEISETDMLWKEMELAMASSYLFEDNEGSNAGMSIGIMKKLSESCQHEYKLDEEIGILCSRCGYVSSEIRDVSAPFMQFTSWNTEEKQCNEENSMHKPDEDDGLEVLCRQASADVPLSEENENVWALIPELRGKLHLHQKRAYEFLWRNIAGSLKPSLMKPASKKTGGCVISHSPGAGKTLLIISFLVSYLKLFPGKRPLVLAPKTTLYTWYKECIKWEIPVPVYLIHGRRTYRVFKQKSPSFHKPMSFPGVPKPTDDVMHVLDCLEKVQKWHAHPSVLVMGYTSFLALMREDSKFAHRRFMARVLRESPGILVLDEGHNPRSTKSRLRKVLMKVETDLRILLSGTLFQNNFCEYFNTLCLARPMFVNEVLKELDPKYKRQKKGTEKALYLREARARKFFLDKIAKRIDSNVGEERRQGINMLRNITNGFIDVYEGGSSDSLPGLQIYTLLMNSTDIQHEILVKLHKVMAECHGYPLELELLITLGSIHPWLVKTTSCASKFFNMRELMELDKYKFDLKKGSKVRFVLNLVYRIFKKEKVLIFCHNIAPVKLFLELFEHIFKWQRGREVLVLTGDLELFERGRVMDKFEEAGGASRVLLASITACAEGISLTAASRVILLDSEWNPSKTKQAIARAFRPGQQRVVYVYQLLQTGTLEEDKYRRTTWKEWVSSMIFSEAFVEDPSRWQAEKIEDDVLREMVEEDRTKTFHMIMKNEKASTS